MYRDISGPTSSPIGLLCSPLLQPIRGLRDGGIRPRARARARQPASQAAFTPKSVSRTAIKHRDVSFVARDRARLINSSRRTRAESSCPHFVARGYAIPPSIVYSFAGYRAISGRTYGGTQVPAFAGLIRRKFVLNYRERSRDIEMKARGDIDRFIKKKKMIRQNV